MTYKVRQKQRDYQREWYRRKKNGEPTQIVNKTPQTKTERQISINEANRRLRKRNREGIIKLLGDHCVFCKNNKNPQAHKVDGKPHEIVYESRLKSVSLEEVERNPQGFVMLCPLCHKSVHWNMKYLNMSWEEIIEKNKENGG